MKIKVKSKGISLRKVNIVMLIVALVATAALVGAMQWTGHLYDKTHKTTQDALGWRGDAHLMIDATDYLTEQMRSFAITGDREYLDNYIEEVNVTKRRERAIEAIKEVDSNSPAYDELCKAMDKSFELIKMECYAARLTIEARGYDISEYPEEIQQVTLSAEDAVLTPEQKENAAEELLFGDKYQDIKEEVTVGGHKCIDIIEDDMLEEQNRLAKRLHNQVLIEHILTFIYIAVLLIIVLINRELVIKPLKNLVKKIREGQNAEEEGAYEVRFVTKAYNLMFNTNLQNKEKVSYDATHDKLTGLYNREGYDFLVKNVDIETTSLLILNVDNYKKVVDNNGSDFGDKVLYWASGIIFRSFRSQDYVCRLEEDEFAVVMINSGPEHKELIKSKVERINEALAKPENNLAPVSVSVGVAFGEGRINFTEVFKQADKALEKAKNNGKKAVVFSKD